MPGASTPQPLALLPDLSLVTPNSDDSSCLSSSVSTASTLQDKGVSRQKRQGRRAVRKDKAKVYKRNRQLTKKVAELQREVWKLKKRKSRENKTNGSPKTPKSKMLAITKGQFINKNVKRSLFKGLVVTEECKRAKENLKSKRLKTAYSRIFSGKVIKKYRLLSQCKDVLPKISSLKGRKWIVQNKASNALFCTNTTEVHFLPAKEILKKREAVKNFFVSNDASHFTPGKKDFVTVNGEKVQKRYLNDTLSALYKAFCSKSSVPISFSMFCKYRPKFVVIPRFKDRDTCLCVKCENFKLLLSGLKAANVVEEKNKNDILSTMCCDIANEDCLFRKCQMCLTNSVNYNVAVNEEKIQYQRWGTANVDHKTKPGVSVKITQRETKETSVGAAVKLFKGMLIDYMAHVARIIHQGSAWKIVESNLSEDDLMIAVDWSENYNCQYSREIQSMHFGASHQQLALHTGYAKSSDFAETFCTVSDDTDHGPKGIFAHLRPVLAKYVSEKIKRVHFFSDGPTTQYRNRKMFKIVARNVSAVIPAVECISWNFSESGHGKGIPDGVKGTVKRNADSIVAHGGDIRDAPTFVTELSKKCPKVFIKLITASQSNEAKNLNVEDVEPFKGTFKVHQYRWERRTPDCLKFKSLSCYCSRGECDHFYMGTLKLPKERISKPPKQNRRSSRKR